jgi:transposase
MARRRRQFTAEFKIEAVRLVESGRPLSAVARELQIGDNLLRRWRRGFAASARSGASSTVSARDVFPGNGKLTSQDEEIRQLRRRVAQLEEEREILKKATAFFARESR